MENIPEWEGKGSLLCAQPAVSSSPITVLRGCSPLQRGQRALEHRVYGEVGGLAQG